MAAFVKQVGVMHCQIPCLYMIYYYIMYRYIAPYILYMYYIVSILRNMYEYLIEIESVCTDPTCRSGAEPENVVL